MLNYGIIILWPIYYVALKIICKRYMYQYWYTDYTIVSKFRTVGKCDLFIQKKAYSTKSHS